MRKPFLLLFLLLGCCMANAKIQLPQLFQSGMVLQRGKPIPVWGKANPQEQIVIRWQKKQYTTIADEQGKWRIDLPKAKAGGPYTLTIGEQELTDVLVGDVWLCSGQSNIDVHIERVYPQYVDEIDHFGNNQIRLFRVRNATNTSSVQDDIMPTSWKPLTKENAWPFSALGTFLGIRMFEKTHVPQGVIVNSWGGTPIEAWLPADSLAKDNPQLLQKTRLYDNKDYIAAQMRANNSADRQWNQMLDQQDPGIANHYTALDCDDSSWATIDQNNWGWRGTGSTWLRQHIQIDKAHAGQPARLFRFTAVIDKVRADSTVKAVVLRVNSPGGSVLASEKIKHELDLLGAEKPLIASYGTYAASGGYWISNNCDKIFSDAVTLTGSIGIFGMVPDFSKTAKDVLHVGVATFTSNKHGDMFSMMRPLDAAEVNYITRSIEAGYDKFITLVSEGRDMPKEKVDEIGQGRVWTGADALGIGLVDEIGTLSDAIAYAAVAAGLPSDGVAVKEFP